MLKRLESYFEFARLGTNWRTEILAGVTTFLTMAYIVLVNPAILAAAGMPLAAVTAATCLSAAFGSIMMGIVARYPIALAPGMGLNAYFTYTVCIKMHVPWQTALGAVFLSGILFLALTAVGIRQMILRAIPHELYAAVASGIGLFIAFIGFQNAGLVVRDPDTLVGLGSIRNPTAASGPSSACSSWWLLKSGRSAAPSSSACSSITALAWAMGLTHWTPTAGGLHSLASHRLPTRHPRRAQQGPAGNRLRLLLRRPLRQPRHPGRRHQARRPHRGRPLHPAPEPHPLHRRHRHRLRLAHRNLHRHQLRRVHSRRGRGRPLRHHRHRHRPALSVPPSAPLLSSASCPRPPLRRRSFSSAR